MTKFVNTIYRTLLLRKLVNTYVVYTGAKKYEEYEIRVESFFYIMGPFSLSCSTSEVIGYLDESIIRIFSEFFHVVIVYHSSDLLSVE